MGGRRRRVKHVDRATNIGDGAVGIECMNNVRDERSLGCAEI